MNKILRYSFVALMAMMFAPSFAEDIIWQEDFSSYKASEVPTGGTYNYACENGGGTTKIYEENLAQGTSPELLVAKKGGFFSAVIPLGGKSGEMMLTYKTNKSELSLEVTGAYTVSEKTRSGNDDSYLITVASGTESITIKIFMPESVNSNARLDNIKLYQGTAKKPAGLSWGTSSRTVTIGANDNVFPTLTNANNLSVTYSSSKQSVATIASDGTITLVGAGTTTITAESEETSEFEKGKAEYTLEVKEAASGEVEEINVAKALEIIDALANGKTTTEIYQIKGIVTAVEEISVEYGNATFNIADNANDAAVLKVFRAKDAAGEKITDAEIVKVGDVVVVQGKLQKYVKDNVITPEVASNGKILTVNGKPTGIVDVKAQEAQGAIYNLAGQQVEKATKGIYIQNGKKFIVK